MEKMFDQKIRHKTLIYAPPEKVYDTITSAAGWDSFFTTGMELDPKPGGICAFAWKDWGPDKVSLKAPGKVVEAARPKLFSFKWGPEGKETTIRMELVEISGGTIIDVTEEGYRDNPEGRAMILECAAGWGEALTLLKFYLEHGMIYTTASSKI